MANETFIMTLQYEDEEPFECDVLYMFDNPGTDKSYIIYAEMNDDDDDNVQTFAASYDSADITRKLGGGYETLPIAPIDDDDEWKMIDSVLADLNRMTQRRADEIEEERAEQERAEEEARRAAEEEAKAAEEEARAAAEEEAEQRAIEQAKAEAREREQARAAQQAAYQQQMAYQMAAYQQQQQQQQAQQMYNPYQQVYQQPGYAQQAAYQQQMAAYQQQQQQRARYMQQQQQMAAYRRQQQQAPDSQLSSFKVRDEATGEIVDCETVCIFSSDETGKDYIIYTNNAQDSDGSTPVYAAVYDSAKMAQLGGSNYHGIVDFPDEPFSETEMSIINEVIAELEAE